MDRLMMNMSSWPSISSPPFSTCLVNLDKTLKNIKRAITQQILKKKKTD